MGGKSIMFWGGFCSKGLLNLHECKVCVNSDEYVELLKENVIPCIRDKHDNLHVF